MSTDRARNELHPRDRLTVLLAQHQRLTDSGKCTCGYQGVLGEMFHGHVAGAVIAAGWLSPAGVRAREREAWQAAVDWMASNLRGDQRIRIDSLLAAEEANSYGPYADALAPTAEPEPKPSHAHNWAADGNETYCATCGESL